MSETLNPTPERNDSSSWNVLWLILTLIAAFGVGGAYVEKRLESLEDKVVAQTGAISQQAFEQSKLTQKEILTNRAESAAIAQSMSNVMEEVSQMMNESVKTFTTQTKQLATAVEAKEKNQAEYLKTKLETLGILTQEHSNGIQTAIEALAKEVIETKTIVLESKQQSNELDVRIAKLTQQMDSINANLQSGLVSLTDLVAQQNELIAAQFAKRSDELSTELTAMRETSAQSFSEVTAQIAALNDTQAQTTESSVKQVHAAISETAGALTDSITNLQNRLADLSDTLEVNQSVTDFNNEVIHSELTDVKNTLEVRTGDLLVESGETQKTIHGLQENTSSEIQAQLKELAQSFEQVSHQVTESQIAAVQAQFSGLSQELSRLEAGINSKIETVNSNLEEAKLAQNDAAKQELLHHLQAITEDVGNFPTSIAEGLTKAQVVLKELSGNPQSSETIQALDSILQELTTSVQTTQKQVQSIKDKISSLTEKLTEITHAPIKEVIMNSANPLTDTGKVITENLHIEADAPVNN